MPRTFRTRVEALLNVLFDICRLMRWLMETGDGGPEATSEMEVASFESTTDVRLEDEKNVAALNVRYGLKAAVMDCIVLL